MRPRELYGVLVRAGGTLCIIFSIFDLIHVVAKLAGYPITTTYSLAQEVMGMCFYLVLGLALIGGAEWVMRIVYGPDRPISK